LGLPARSFKEQDGRPGIEPGGGDHDGRWIKIASHHPPGAQQCGGLAENTAARANIEHPHAGFQEPFGFEAQLRGLMQNRCRKPGPG
jgi:hypothetical protein